MVIAHGIGQIVELMRGVQCSLCRRARQSRLDARVRVMAVPVPVTSSCAPMPLQPVAGGDGVVDQGTRGQGGR